jgi:N-glycosylase/DNA lyase
LSIVTVRIAAPDPLQPDDTIHVTTSPAVEGDDRTVLERRVRWMLRLEEDFTPFHALLASLAGCERPVQRGEGRLLRSWDFFEDAVKTLCTTNTTWAQTRSMVTRLVDRYGERGENGSAFPEPARLAAATELELRALGLGYRAGAVLALAAAITEGALPREGADWSTLASDELQTRLLELRGVGPYAAANLRMLLGRYDRLAIDSWLRRAVRDAWFGGAPVTDPEIEARFSQFGAWRALVYWFHPSLHPARDAWREKAGEEVRHGPVQKKRPCCP